MGKYTIKDFKVGDKVYHLSNTKLMMVAIEINQEINEVSCRWVDKDGHVQCLEFMAEELGKSNDLAPRISVM
ncbi:MAG: hypothetical protein ABJH04_11775 [Cyclobacteriaceae bacterium]